MDLMVHTLLVAETSTSSIGTGNSDTISWRATVNAVTSSSSSGEVVQLRFGLGGTILWFSSGDLAPQRRVQTHDVLRRDSAENAGHVNHGEAAPLRGELMRELLTAGIQRAVEEHWREQRR